jgi:hypothetical protein
MQHPNDSTIRGTPPIIVYKNINGEKALILGDNKGKAGIYR